MRKCKRCAREIRRKDNVSGYCTICRETAKCEKCKRSLERCLIVGCMVPQLLIDAQIAVTRDQKQHKISQKIAWNIWDFIEIQKNDGWVTRRSWTGITTKSTSSWTRMIRVMTELFPITQELMSDNKTIRYKIVMK